MLVDTLVQVFAEAEPAPPCGTRRCPVASAAGTRLRGARILLTEDNEINQQISNT